jgi:hypothetical protein
VLRGPENPRVVRNVAAHQDECVWVCSCACEAAEVPDCVPGAIEQVETAVSKIIVGRELSDAEGFRWEGDFAEGSISKCDGSVRKERDKH